jgi:hypothetical protein
MFFFKIIVLSIFRSIHTRFESFLHQNNRLKALFPTVPQPLPPGHCHTGTQPLNTHCHCLFLNHCFMYYSLNTHPIHTILAPKQPHFHALSNGTSFTATRPLPHPPRGHRRPLEKLLVPLVDRNGARAQHDARLFNRAVFLIKGV